MSIDWGNVLTHGLWIVGLAIVLGLLSYADWRASTGSRGPRSMLRDLAYDPVLYLGLALICLGAALGVAAGWQRLLWLLLLAAVALAGTCLAIVRRKASSS